jgi:hypothetical protein
MKSDGPGSRSAMLTRPTWSLPSSNKKLVLRFDRKLEGPAFAGAGRLGSMFVSPIEVIRSNFVRVDLESVLMRSGERSDLPLPRRHV